MDNFFQRLKKRLSGFIAVSMILQGVVFVAPTEAASQSNYRWRNDDGTESSATPAADEDTQLTGVAVGATKRLRFAVDADASDASLSTVSTVSTDTGEGYVESVFADNNGFFYSSSGESDNITKYAVGIGNASPTIVGTLALNAGEGSDIQYVLFDETNGYAYYILNTSPTKIVKVSISGFSRVGALTLDSGEGSSYSGFIDSSGGYLYITCSETTPAKVVKVSLSSFTKTGVMSLSTDKDLVFAATVDPGNSFAYLGVRKAAAPLTNTKITKIDISSLAEIATIDLGDVAIPESAVADVANGFAYFGRQGVVTKVDIDPGNTFAEVDETSVCSYPLFAGIDTVHLNAYFGCSNGLVVRIDIDPGNTFTNTGSTSAGGSPLTGLGIDTDAGYLYSSFGSTSPDTIAKTHIGTSNIYRFRLEYGLYETACGDISSWTQVPATPTTEEWGMSPSANITNGASTTDSADVTNNNANFIPGKIHDTTSQTAEITLDNAAGDTTEIEFSIEATSNAIASSTYCFRLSDAGDTTNFNFNNYAEAVMASGTTDPTTTNAISMTRLKQGVSSDISISFVLQNTITGTLTVTFPVGFTVTSAFTDGSCTGGSVGTFGFTSSTLTAVKSSCAPGILTVSGATVTNPVTPGSYYISWVNDDPGGSQVYIIDDDQVTVTANVDPALTMNVGAQAAATACDGTFAGNGGTVALGVLTSGAVTSSDAASVNHICTRLSTNASSGAVMTVKSLNGVDGLKSASVPTDKIPSPGGSSTIVAGTAGYAICAGSAGGDSGNDAIAGSASPVRSSPFNGASCTSTGHSVGGLTTSAQNLWTLSNGAQNAFVRVYVKAAISPVTAAHSDYTDTLTFIGTGTF